MNISLELFLGLLRANLEKSLGNQLISISENIFSDSFQLDIVARDYWLNISVSLHHLDLPWEIKDPGMNVGTHQKIELPMPCANQNDPVKYYLTPAVLKDNSILTRLVKQVTENIREAVQ